MRMHGSKGQVAFGDVSPAVVIASLNKWTLNMARDRVDVTSFGDENKEYVQGLRDIKGTLGGFLDYGTGSPAAGGNDPLFAAADGEEPVTLILSPNIVKAPGRNWTGLAYLDVSIDVAANGAVTLGGSFAAAGPWSQN